MSSWLTPKNTVITLMVLLLVAAGAAGTYLAEHLYLRPMREQKQLIANLELLVERLTRDQRVAEVVVLEQGGEPLKTKFRWVEVDEKDPRKRIGGPKEFTVEGDVAYFDSLVIKFEEGYKPLNELPLKQKDIAEKLANKSLIVFRRVFGEKQQPADGFPLDSPGDAPTPYKASKPFALFEQNFEQKLWNEFWQLANNPDLAKDRGVRAAHGQAVYTQLKPGFVYVIERRLTGELTIRPETLRPVQQQP